MIRSIVFPRVLGRSLEDLQPAMELLCALGFARGNEWHEGGNHGVEMLAPSGGIEFIAAADAPGVDAMVEVSDADAAYEIVKSLRFTLSAREADKGGAPTAKGYAEDPLIRKSRMSGTPEITVTKEIGDTPYGARLFEIEISGLRLGFLTYTKRPSEGSGMEGKLDASGEKFAVVVSRFNSFITERLLDGALQALRQCGARPHDIAVVHVPGAFEIPSAARLLAETGQYKAIVCIGCLLRGGTLHYEVIANEVTRGVGQSAQETGVPHAFGVLTCDTLEQAIDRAGLKAGNKGYEAGLAAVEMASLREAVAKSPTAGPSKNTAAPSTRTETAGRDDKTAGVGSSAHATDGKP